MEMSVLMTAQGGIVRTSLKHNMTNENVKECIDEGFENET